MLETFNIIGIDPGINTGVSIYNINVDTFEILNIETKIYKLDNFLQPNDCYFQNHMYDRCIFLNNIVNELMVYYNPLAVAYESAFMNSKYATAVIQLTQYTSTIDRAIRDYNKFIKVFTYPPKYIKREVGAGAVANKDDMLANALKIPVFNKYLKLETLTEHEIDATSIAYVLYNDLIDRPWLLYLL